jgi:excisionase family DNA binding protein
MQGWRTRAEVAKELGVTERTLQRRLAESGIRPARPGRIAMLSDADVTKLMEESRRRSHSQKPALEPLSPGEATSERGQQNRRLVTEVQQIRRILDGIC